MGTISASAYENNVMAEFEQKRINPLIKDKFFFSYNKLMISFCMDQIRKTAKKSFRDN